jgi:hypothetical protein
MRAKSNWEEEPSHAPDSTPPTLKDYLDGIQKQLREVLSKIDRDRLNEDDRRLIERMEEDLETGYAYVHAYSNQPLLSVEEDELGESSENMELIALGVESVTGPSPGREPGAEGHIPQTLFDRLTTFLAFPQNQAAVLTASKNVLKRMKSDAGPLVEEFFQPLLAMILQEQGKAFPSFQMVGGMGEGGQDAVAAITAVATALEQQLDHLGVETVDEARKLNRKKTAQTDAGEAATVEALQYLNDKRKATKSARLAARAVQEYLRHG